MDEPNEPRAFLEVTRDRKVNFVISGRVSESELALIAAAIGRRTPHNIRYVNGEHIDLANLFTTGIQIAAHPHLTPTAEIPTPAYRDSTLIDQETLMITWDTFRKFAVEKHPNMYKSTAVQRAKSAYVALSDHWRIGHENGSCECSLKGERKPKGPPRDWWDPDPNKGEYMRLSIDPISLHEANHKGELKELRPNKNGNPRPILNTESGSTLRWALRHLDEIIDQLRTAEPQSRGQAR